MTADEFKAQFPHLAHLEGNELWDAMEAAILARMKPFEWQEGDDEIVDRIQEQGFTFCITRGMKRWEEAFMKDVAPPTFSNEQMVIPQERLPDGRPTIEFYQYGENKEDDK